MQLVWQVVGTRRASANRLRGSLSFASTKGADELTLLESVSGPGDLKKLSPEQVPLLAAEIRDLLIEVVSRTSGHLGPNLGVVELTIALHRVFDSPMDRI